MTLRKVVPLKHHDSLITTGLTFLSALSIGWQGPPRPERFGLQEGRSREPRRSRRLQNSFILPGIKLT